MLEVTLTHAFKGFSLDLAFKGGRGVTALFGRSGAGKTTVVNAIAGLLTPDKGQISLDKRTLFDSTSNTNLPAQQRRIGYVFQDGRLFPHLTVQQNLMFGTRYSQNPATAQEASAISTLLGITSLLTRKPHALSGGEQQRVALGRALLSKPDLLLMDEPLAALDAQRKDDILPYLEQLRDSANSPPILYVSHSIHEIARLADDIVVLQNGAVKAQGPIFDVLSDPAHIQLFGVQDAGAVVLAKLEAQRDDGLSTLSISAGQLTLPKIDAALGTQLRLRVRAQDVILSKTKPKGLSARNILPATITDIKMGDGPGAAVGLMAGTDHLLARITQNAVQDLGLQQGQKVYAILKATSIARVSVGQDRR
jgi:molybdate transport system ATP-binding protein